MDRDIAAHHDAMNMTNDEKDAIIVAVAPVGFLDLDEFHLRAIFDAGVKHGVAEIADALATAEARIAQLEQDRDKAINDADRAIEIARGVDAKEREQYREALRNLLAQVEKFCEEEGEADFYTGEARALLATKETT